MTDKTLISIGKKLQAARKLKDLTQQDVATKVGISRTYYSQIEKGERNPAATVIMDIVKVLGVDISNILN
ncbi:MAG TPA: helix-turn-helix transcriptional regulator [Candidatus Saccharimonadales bacterium]|jgi:transcriptional regulator with XRE-family HTH domain|nr:helix-turn-helix transcriptional regulator [Candidatus Saccharimonadales bacterium]